MFTFWIILSIIIPLTLAFLHTRFKMLHYVLDGVALIAFLFASNLMSFSIYNMIHDGTVFMTTIHGLFLDPLFLIAGGYLIVYTSYRLAYALT